MAFKHPGGSLWKVRVADNMVVAAGIALPAGWLRGEVVVAPSHVAFGDSDALSTEDMTELQGTELGRAAITPSGVDDLVIFSGTVGGLGAPETVGEFGIFNDASAGIMWCRWITPAFVMPAGVTIDVVWQIRIGE